MAMSSSCAPLDDIPPKTNMRDAATATAAWWSRGGGAGQGLAAPFRGTSTSAT